MVKSTPAVIGERKTKPSRLRDRGAEPRLDRFASLAMTAKMGLVGGLRDAGAEVGDDLLELVVFERLGDLERADQEDRRRLESEGNRP